jgi:adenylate cyclase
MSEANRRLAAILAADVVGYSAMVGKDKPGTLARVRTLRTGIPLCPCGLDPASD